jgi:hypothetical protein
MAQSRTLDGGLDGQHAAIAVADRAQAPGAEGPALGTIGPRHGDRDHRRRQRPSQAPPLGWLSEAGPWGSWLSRDRTTTGHHGWGVAPSLLPNQAGDRVHTDRRDAGHRARLRRSGELTPVSMPQAADDARWDLSRARAEALDALQAATCRLNACWRRQASRYPGRAPCQGDSQHTRHASRPSAGQRTSGLVSAPGASGLAVNRPPRGSGRWPCGGGLLGALAQEVPVAPCGRLPAGHCSPDGEGVPPGIAAPPPRCGATPDGVKRRQEPLVPRVRPAPAGDPSGGPNPRRSTGAPGGCDWLRLFPCTQGKHQAEDLPPLDLGSHINAKAQRPGRAPRAAGPLQRRVRRR